jgi:DNA-binding Lrp family transcriptional regulator
MLDELNQKLLAQISEGLPICSRPYLEIGEKLGISENDVLSRLKILQTSGIIKRFGVVVKHSTLGYRANAMCVWRIPENQVDNIAQQCLKFSFVTLCYQRPALPDWNYNLYCMIHGKDRNTVLNQLSELKKMCGLQAFEHQILFSRKCFKQRGAIYQN